MRRIKSLCVLFVLLLVGACAHHPLKVECDRNLTPINPPTPIVKPGAVATSVP
jgi:hypothetical protein